MTRGDPVAAAVQLPGFVLLSGGVAAAALGGRAGGVDLVPGHLAGLAVLTAGMAWPLWPATRAYVARRVNLVIPTLSVLAIVAAFVTLTTLWDEPVVITVPSWTAIVGAALIAGCWMRIRRLREPVRRPAAGRTTGDR